VTALMKIGVPIKAANFLTRWGYTCFWKETLLFEVNLFVVVRLYNRN